MADTTIVNTPAREGDSAGWVVALIVIIAVIFGGFMWYRYYRVPASTTSTTNINVTNPAPTSGTPAPAGATTQ